MVAGSRTASIDLADRADDDTLVAVDVDLCAPEGPQHLVETANGRFGGVDVLVNNVGGLAGGSPRFGGFLSVADADWSSSIELNLMSAVRATRAAIPVMLNRGGGAIVNVSSLNGSMPDPNVIDYSATKAALGNLSKALSVEFAPRGIRVNTVSPGPVRTPLWTGPGGVGDQLAAAMGTDREAAMQAIADGQGGIKLGRFGTADEVAHLVLFLIGPATWMTGNNVIIDGGLTRTI